MQCREFREVSESYLSDELLVETNIQVFQHLENCPNCRREFGEKREFRQKIRVAVKNADEFQMNPVFATRLNQNLREMAVKKNIWRKNWFAPKFLLPAMASLLLAVTFGLIWLNFNGKKEEPILSQENSIQEIPNQDITNISLKAVGSHKYCALKKLKTWEEMAKRDYPEKEAYTEKVANPLKANFSEEVEMLHAHDCLFEGKKFNHIILKKGNQIASVFVDKSVELPEKGRSEIENITNKKESHFQIAGFLKNKRATFFISDMTEAENMKAAQTIRDLSDL